MTRPAAHSVVLYVSVAACLAFACASARHAAEASAWPAGGAVAGAAAGSLVGPGGTLVGAGVGAIVGHSLGENAELRAGTLQGDEAAEAWRGRAVGAESGLSSLQSLMHWIVLGVLGWFLFRNREHILKAVKGRSFSPLIHALAGGAIGRPKG